MARWIVVADSSRARFFSYHGLRSPLTEFDDLAHSESRLRESQITEDLPGRHSDSAGQGRHALEQKLPVKDQEARLFAQQIAAYLDRACADNRLDSLIIIAAPKFLGQLRDSLSDNIHGIISSEISKNLVQQGADQIRKHISEPVPFI